MRTIRPCNLCYRLIFSNAVPIQTTVIPLSSFIKLYSLLILCKNFKLSNSFFSKFKKFIFNIQINKLIYSTPLSRF